MKKPTRADALRLAAAALVCEAEHEWQALSTLGSVDALSRAQTALDGGKRRRRPDLVALCRATARDLRAQARRLERKGRR